MRRLLYLAVLSMLATALTANVAFAQARGPSGADGSYNCEDFDSQASAQAYFEAHNPTQDPDGLDGAVGFDSTGTPGVACESLPGPKDLTPAPGYPGGGSTEGSTMMEESTATPTTPMEQSTMGAGGAQYGQSGGGVSNLPNTGGPSLLLFGGALLAGMGILGITLLRRRTE